jgi:titin
VGVLPPIPIPTFGSVTPTAGGWTVLITNYDSAAIYTLTTTSGSVSQTSGTITQSGLGNNVSATATLIVSKSGYTSYTTTLSGTSQSQLTAPTFGTRTSISGGYTFAISNYSALNTYTFSVTNGGSATQSSGNVTVTSIGDAVTATCTVTVSRSGFVQNSANTTGTSFTKLATPTFSGYQAGATPGRFKFNISIGNYDSANTYTVSVSAGSFVRSGSLITVSGLSDSQSSTVYVTASRSGFTNSAQAAGAYSAPGTPCAAGTYLYGPVYYASIGGVPGACGYNGVCDGNYGIGLAWVSGPCQITCGGDYCAGGGNCC